MELEEFNTPLAFRTVRNLLHILTIGFVGEGPRASIIVIDGMTEQPVSRLEFGTRNGDARSALSIIERDLAAMSVPEFREKYAIF